VAAVGGGEGGLGCAGDGEQGSTEECAAGGELAGVGFGEGRTGEIEGEQAGVGRVGLGGVDRGER
jgi:hypothetical protein